jgi:hypothetical protein
MPFQNMGLIRGSLIALDTIRPFSVPLNDMVEHLAFNLCPLYILGFSDSVKNWPELIAIVILSDAILYGALFAGIAGIVHLIRRIAG